TGNTVAFQNGTNSTNAFNVQNALGNRIVTIDSANALLTLGTSSFLDGKLVFSNVSNGNTVTILPGIPTTNRTLTLPNASGVICTDSGNCAGAGATLQTAYNFSVGGTTPKIKVNSSLGGVDIQDSDTPIGANLLNVRASNGAGLGSVMFGVGNTGAVTLQNSANSTSAFRLLTAGGTAVLVGDTTNGQILLGQSSTLSGAVGFRNASNANVITLTTSTPTADRTINLPDSSGTICLTSGNCSGSGSSNTLQAAYDAGNTVTTTTARNVLFTMADNTTDANFLVDLQCDTSCGTNGRFAIQDDGTDVLSVSPSGAVLLQNTVNSSLGFRISNAGGSALLTADTTNGRVAFGQNGLAGVLQLFEPTSGSDVATLQTATLTASRTITIGDESGTICLQTSVNCGFLTGATTDYIQNQNSVNQTANFRISGTGRANTSIQTPLLDTAAAGTLSIGTTNATAIALQQNVTVASGKTVIIQGNTSIQPTVDGIAFNIKSSLTNNQFTVDTANGRVGIALGASVNPTLQSTGLEIKGAIRLSGGNGTFSDTYTTPLGGSVNTLINIANYDPGASAQLIALGLPSGANTNSRAITVLDARASAHQPSIAVISPDESQIGGFSWEGSNTAFSVKNSASGVINLNVGGSNRLVTSTTGTGINVAPVTTALDIVTANATDKGIRLAAATGQSANLMELNVTGVGSIVTISATGASTFKTSTNTATAFRVLNASDVPNFVVDTTNSRVYIGNPTADATGALLVLDTKNTSGDPTGVNGGMYYNSNAQRFRCYEDSGWTDCVGPNGLRRVQLASDTAMGDADVGEFVTLHTVTLSNLKPNHIYNLKIRVPTYTDAAPIPEFAVPRVRLHKTNAAGTVLDTSEAAHALYYQVKSLEIDYDYRTGPAETSATFAVVGTNDYDGCSSCTPTAFFVSYATMPYYFRATDTQDTSFDSF
ncbi:MAG: hypothetical protein ABWX94_03170, partial [Candidatus Saccharimonadales bacterium]